MFTVLTLSLGSAEAVKFKNGHLSAVTCVPNQGNLDHPSAQATSTSFVQCWLFSGCCSKQDRADGRDLAELDFEPPPEPIDINVRMIDGAMDDCVLICDENDTIETVKDKIKNKYTADRDLPFVKFDPLILTFGGIELSDLNSTLKEYGVEDGAQFSCKFSDSRIVDHTDGRYVGQLKNGKWHGQGTWFRANGDQYEGQWRHGKPHGQGTYTWANGRRYEGQYQNGKKHGQGIVTWADGSQYEVEYENGKELLFFY